LRQKKKKNERIRVEYLKEKRKKALFGDEFVAVLPFNILEKIRNL
jgi:hypothetical protein